MAKLTKREKTLAEIDRLKIYDVSEAIGLLKGQPALNLTKQLKFQ